MTPEELADQLLNDPIDAYEIGLERYMTKEAVEETTDSTKRLFVLLLGNLASLRKPISLVDAKTHIRQLLALNIDPAIERAREDSDMTTDDILKKILDIKLRELQKNNPGQISLEALTYGTGIALQKLLEDEEKLLRFGC